MQWTDRIRQVKLILVVAAILIAAVSLAVSHYLVRSLESEERDKMEIWAEAMRALNKADENTDLNLVLKVINENHTIPVIVMDAAGDVQTYRNINLDHRPGAGGVAYLKALGNSRKASNHYIRIFLNDHAQGDYIDVCYDDSLMLKRLAFYPYVQLCVALIFVVMVIVALLTSKRAEQNKVWVGLSKETAHQLGTPISSLMAWTEILKESYPDDALIPEMEQDVRRLQLIADRFSKIGSKPEVEPCSLREVVSHVTSYMNRRTSKGIQIVTQLPESADGLMVRMNPSLFEWVIENLCKNAVDAMGGEQGCITIRVQEAVGKVVIDVTDTGKGIRKKDIKNVFRPGFTTKKRGWGLGLSLAKRIIEEYHRGRIWVKSSEMGKGTTFRIELNR